jgi:hypothetical protein
MVVQNVFTNLGKSPTCITLGEKVKPEPIQNWIY